MVYTAQLQLVRRIDEVAAIANRKEQSANIEGIEPLSIRIGDLGVRPWSGTAENPHADVLFGRSLVDGGAPRIFPRER